MGGGLQGINKCQGQHCENLSHDNPSTFFGAFSRWGVQCASSLPARIRQYLSMTVDVLVGSRDVSELSQTAQDYQKSSNGQPYEWEKEVYAYVDIPERELEQLRSQLPEGRFGLVTSREFGYLDDCNFSGWKLHIPGTSLRDSVSLVKLLNDCLVRWKAPAKVGAESHNPVISGHLILQDSIQWGKSGATIYIPPHVFAENRLSDFINDIRSAIKGYPCDIPISGDEKLVDNIYYRYDLTQAVGINGVGRARYYELYRANQIESSYKPEGITDPFTRLTL